MNTVAGLPDHCSHAGEAGPQSAHMGYRTPTPDRVHHQLGTPVRQRDRLTRGAPQ